MDGSVKPCRIELFGGLRAWSQERCVAQFQTRKVAGLLAYLAYHNRRSAREALAEMLWPESALETGRRNLNQALFMLRRDLEPLEIGSRHLIVADRVSIGLDPQAFGTDAADFMAALRNASEAPSASQRSDLLLRAVQLYQIGLLPGFYEEWVSLEQARLADLYVEALGRLAALLAEQGDHCGALRYARQRVRVDPLREEAHCALMRLYLAVDQPSAALRQFQELAAILHDELHASPGASACRLAHEIERGLDWSDSRLRGRRDLAEPVHAVTDSVEAGRCSDLPTTPEHRLVTTRPVQARGLTAPDDERPSDHALRSREQALYVVAGIARKHCDRELENSGMLLAVAEEHKASGLFLPRGDLAGAAAHYREAHRIYSELGDTTHAPESLYNTICCLLNLGDLDAAADCMEAMQQWFAARDGEFWAAWLQLRRGVLEGCRARPEQAEASFRSALACIAAGSRLTAWAALYLGRLYLTLDRRSEAAAYFHRVFAFDASYPPLLYAALAGLEAALDGTATFRTECERLRAERPHGTGTFSQWSLEPVETASGGRTAPVRWHSGTQAEGPATPGKGIPDVTPAWQWHDPFGDCWHMRRSPAGWIVGAANGRNLWGCNISAPHLLTPVSGDFAVQVTCLPLDDGRPCIGGLLLWQDEQQFLCLNRGFHGKRAILFTARIGGRDRYVGRGHLLSDRMLLRLERRGSRVRALCCAGRSGWLTAGEVDFPVGSDLQVGLYAVGAVDRTVYPGAHRAGSAIGFEEFELSAEVLAG